MTVDEHRDGNLPAIPKEIAPQVARWGHHQAAKSACGLLSTARRHLATLTHDRYRETVGEGDRFLCVD
jgi:hypothetical protein